MDIKLPESFEYYSQLLITGTGLIVFIIKVRSYFSDSRKRQSLKTDLEILNLSNNSNLQDVQIIRERVEQQIHSIFNKELRGKNSFTDFLTGLILFIGFGLWSADLINTSIPSFNPWCILTLFFSIMGLSMMLFDSKEEDKVKPFVTIGIYDKANLRIAFIITLICGVILTILTYSTDKFTFWMFVNGFICFLGIMTFVRNIKRIK